MLDQGQCESCWSFATTQFISNRIIKTGGQAASDLKAWGSILSAEVPVALYHAKDSTIKGCNGGFGTAAANIIAKIRVLE